MMQPNIQPSPCMTTDAAIALLATRECPHMHARMSEAACHAFQARWDSENSRTWKNGSCISPIPHICFKWGCEHYLDHESRPAPEHKSSWGNRPIKPNTTAPRKIECYRCGSTDKKNFNYYDKQVPGDGKITVICKACKAEERKVRACKTVTVICPDCKQKREVKKATAAAHGYTGRCVECSLKLKASKRPPKIARFPKPYKTIKHHHCKFCGETEPKNFDAGKKEECTECRKKRVKAYNQANLVDVACPMCGIVRKVQKVVTRKPKYTGLCYSCSWKEKK